MEIRLHRIPSVVEFTKKLEGNYLISLLDVDISGRLGYTEFLQLWSLLRSWKVIILYHC